MSSELIPLADDEIAVIPVEGSVDLALAIGKGIGEIDAPVPRSLVDAAVKTGGLLGGATAATSLLFDGSLVRLAPETVQALNQGAVFAKDAQGCGSAASVPPARPASAMPSAWCREQSTPWRPA
jgi:hypothetical protein